MEWLIRLLESINEVYQLDMIKNAYEIKGRVFVERKLYCNLSQSSFILCAV